MYKKSILILSMLTLLVVGCAAPMPATQRDAETGVVKEAVVERSSAPSANYQAGAAKESQPEAKRIVVKNASLSIAVDDPARSMDTISEMAEEMGGFVVSANLYQVGLESGAKVHRATITIRVPVERLDEALTRIKAETNQPVISENINSEDVTYQYTDLQSRLRNAEAAEAELTKFLDTAQKTDDVLNVYAQLKQVREEIEVLKGQIQYYDQSAALSAVSVELLANESVLTIGGWQPVGVAKDAIQALIVTLKFLATAAIWFVLFCSPLLLIVALVLFVAWRVFRRVRKARKHSPLLPPSEAPVA
jgi:hypothetical protein